MTDLTATGQTVELTGPEQALGLAVALIGNALRGDSAGMLLAMDGARPELAEHVIGALAQIAADALVKVYGRERVEAAVATWRPGDNLFVLLDAPP